MRWQGSSRRKVTGGKVIVARGKRKFEMGRESADTRISEIKRKNVPVEKHLGYFACYVSFFPKLIQGPIERPQHFLPQLREKKYFDYNLKTKLSNIILTFLECTTS